MNLIRPPEDARCPRCYANGVSAEGLQLPLSRFLSWASRHIMRLRVRCNSCRLRFWHVHVLPRTVIGYHGCNLDFARRLVAGSVNLDEWKASKHSYDWLGAGIYFWEHAPGRAWEWAREQHPDNPAVIATEINLGTCLDLADTLFTDLLRQAHHGIVELYQREGWQLPRNEGYEQKLRKLDRLVIDTLTEAAEEKGTAYQTVRCPFEEGDIVYPGGMIKEQSHIQIAVRDKTCISSRIFLIDPLEPRNDQARAG